MPIEVPDTRAFSEPPRRRRTALKPSAAEGVVAAEVGADGVVPAEALAAATAELVGAGVTAGPAETSAFSKPVRRRKPAVEPRVEPPAQVVAEVAGVVAESAFSKPVRRRKPAVEPPAEVVAEVAGPAAESAFSKPMRRRSPVLAEPAAAEPEPAAESAFSKPVRRRPRTSAADGASVEVASETPIDNDVAPVSAAAPHPSTPLEPSTDAAAIPAQHRNDAAAEADPVAPAAVLVPEMPAAAGNPRPEPVDERPIRADVDELPEVTDTVVVRLAGTRYAVAMGAVAEVGRPPHVTRVPGVPAWLAGVANWRGRIMPVLDLRVLLGAPTTDLSVTGRIMVLTRDGVTLAFLAERVEGVVGLELDRLEPVLATLSRSTASVLSGQLAHPDGPIALLDLDTVFALRSQLPRVRRAG